MRKTAVWALLGILFVCVSLSAQSSNAVVTEATINAPLPAVWDAFSTKQGIESWMVAKTDFQLRVGYLWRTSYSKDSNLDDAASIHHTILAFDPGHMIAYRTVKPPQGFPYPNALAKTWAVIYFEPAGAAQTKVTCRMLGFGDDAESQAMRTFFEAGNKSTLDSLSKRFASAR